MTLFKWLGWEAGFRPSKMPESVKWLALRETKETSRDIEGGALDTGPGSGSPLGGSISKTRRRRNRPNLGCGLITSLLPFGFGNSWISLGAWR